jgi:hypothetical protein
VEGVRAKLWIPTEDGDSRIEPCFLDAEINDVDNIFVQLGNDAGSHQLELGEHSALLLCVGLMRLVAASQDMRNHDIIEAVGSLNRAIDGVEDEEE